jgi:hypothetical protein
MKYTLKSVALIAFLVLSACTPQYLSWQGGRVSPGSVEGGAVKRVAGIDFWESGTPNRAYVIVGLIQHTRPSGPHFMMHRSPQVAALAREKGADAIILKSRSSELAGGSGTAALMPGGAFGIASGAAIYRMSVEYLAIRYVN